MKRAQMSDDGRVLRVRIDTTDVGSALRELKLGERLRTQANGPLLSDRERDAATIAILRALQIID